MSTTSPILPPRRAGKRGLRQISPHIPELQLSNFRKAVSPPPPTGDVTGGLTEWGMFGNDKYGDCGAAATYHGFMAKALALSGTTAAVTNYLQATYEPGFVLPTDASVETTYFAYGRAMGEPGDQPDQGVSNDTWLKFLKDQGIIELYAQLDVTNPDQIHQAMLDFRGVLVGIALTGSAEQEFENHQPWNASPTEQPNPQEGHDIYLVKYDTTVPAAAETFITWGALQDATIDWENAEAPNFMDAWVFFSKEDADRVGVDAAALESEINAWTSAQTVEKKSLLQRAEEWAEKEIDKVEGALEHI